jgi:hypothetical protein
METTEKPKKPLNANREKLLIISNDAKALRERLIQEAETPDIAVYWQTRTVNFILIKYFYKVAEGMELGTFNQWKGKNCMIKKGEKALVIWGQPLNAQRAEKAETNGKAAPDEDESGEYFPMCFLFTADQVMTAEEIEAEKKSKQDRRDKRKEIAVAIANLQAVNFDLVL